MELYRIQTQFINKMAIKIIDNNLSTLKIMFHYKNHLLWICENLQAKCTLKFIALNI